MLFFTLKNSFPAFAFLLLAWEFLRGHTYFHHWHTLNLLFLLLGTLILEILSLWVDKTSDFLNSALIWTYKSYFWDIKLLYSIYPFGIWSLVIDREICWAFFDLVVIFDAIALNDEFTHITDQSLTRAFCFFIDRGQVNFKYLSLFNFIFELSIWSVNLSEFIRQNLSIFS